MSVKAGLKFNIQNSKIMASSPIISWQIDGETMETVTDFIFLGSKIIADSDCSHEIKRRLLLGSKAMKNLDSMLKRHYFANEGLFSQSCDFSSSHVWMWELDYKNAKELMLWTVVLGKTLESPLDCKEIKPVNPKGNEYSLEGLMLNLKLQYFGHLMQRTDSFENFPPDAGKDWRQEEKGTTENEMVGWHHWLDGHEFE